MAKPKQKKYSKNLLEIVCPDMIPRNLKVKLNGKPLDNIESVNIQLPDKEGLIRVSLIFFSALCFEGSVPLVHTHGAKLSPTHVSGDRGSRKGI